MFYSLHREFLDGVGDIDEVLHLHYHLPHEIIRELDLRYLGRFDDVRRRRDRGRQGSRGSCRERIHGNVVPNVVNSLMVLMGSC